MNVQAMRLAFADLADHMNSALDLATEAQDDASSAEVARAHRLVGDHLHLASAALERFVEAARGA